MLTRVQVIESIEQGILTTQQGADVLKVTVRQMRRIKARYRGKGRDGLRDGRAGSPRKKRISASVRAEVLSLRREHYADFNVRHFHEQLVEKYKIAVSYSWTLTILQHANLAPKLERRGTYRRKRPRQPMRGMRMHLDGSTHPWLGEDQPHWDLNVVLDDATSEMLYAQFVEEEGTMSTLDALKSVLEKCGRFVELYVDKGSHFCHIDSETKKPVQTTQVARALKTLGIRMINAHSPEARGRSERCFGTIQGRLPQELRLAGITDYEAANRYLNEVFIPDFNKRFTVKPQQEHSMFSALPVCNLEQIFSFHHERTVRKDYTVQFENKHLQIPNSRSRPRPKQKVTVHRFLDLTLGISYNGQLLASYKPDGTPFQAGASSPKLPTQPQPTPPDPAHKRPPGPSDDDFYAFLTPQPTDNKTLSKKGATQPTVVSRRDLNAYEILQGRTL